MFLKRRIISILLLFLLIVNPAFSKKKNPISVPSKVQEKINQTEETSKSWYICELKGKTKAGNVLCGPVENRELILLIWIANSCKPDKDFCIAKNKTYITKNPEKFFSDEFAQVKADISEFGVADTYEKYFFSNYLNRAVKLSLDEDEIAEISREAKAEEAPSVEETSAVEEPAAEETPAVEETAAEESKTLEAPAVEEAPVTEPVKEPMTKAVQLPETHETPEVTPAPQPEQTEQSAQIAQTTAPVQENRPFQNYPQYDSSLGFKEPEIVPGAGEEPPPSKQVNKQDVNPQITLEDVSNSIPPVTQTKSPAPVVSTPAVEPVPEPEPLPVVEETPAVATPEPAVVQEEAPPQTEQAAPQEETAPEEAAKPQAEEASAPQETAPAPIEETVPEETSIPETTPAPEKTIPQEEPAPESTFELPINSEPSKPVSRYQRENLLDYAPKKTPALPVDEDPDQFKKIAKPDKADSKGVTLLMKAAKNGNETEVRNLIQSGANVKLKDKDGWTALMYAVRYQSGISIVEQLISAGSDIKAKNKYDISALSLAATYNENSLILKRLTSYYDPSEKELMQAFILMLSDNSSSEASKAQKVDAFIERSINPNSFYNGKTPLMYAAQYCTSTLVIKKLLEYGASPSVRTADGKTAFDYAKNNSSLPHDSTYWELNRK